MQDGCVGLAVVGAEAHEHGAVDDRDTFLHRVRDLLSIHTCMIWQVPKKAASSFCWVCHLMFDLWKPYQNLLHLRNSNLFPSRNSLKNLQIVINCQSSFFQYSWIVVNVCDGKVGWVFVFGRWTRWSSHVCFSTRIGAANFAATDRASVSARWSSPFFASGQTSMPQQPVKISSLPLSQCFSILFACWKQQSTELISGCIALLPIIFIHA